jgi:hypothetical protein
MTFAESTGWLSIAQQASVPTLSVAALLLAVTALIKVLPQLLPQLRQIRLEGDQSLRDALLKRVETLEAEVVALRGALDLKQEQHTTKIADLQHDLNNESGNLDALIMLAEANPDKVLEQIPKIKELRREHRERMAMKRGAREGAREGAASAALKEAQGTAHD